jgi:hypothetical protein
MGLLIRFIVFVSIILMSCNITPGSLTENEDKGIKEIIGFYGGQCEYGVEKKANAMEGSKTNFWIKFSKSADIDSLQKIAEMPASNMAYIFYKNLDKEKTNYDEIESELVFGNGESLKFNYPLSNLEKVKVKIELVNKIVQIIKEKKFKSLKNYMNADTVLFKVDDQLLISKLEGADRDLGNVVGFTPFGFTFSKVNGVEILHIAGLVKRDKKSHYLSVNLNPDDLTEHIYSVDYSL